MEHPNTQVYEHLQFFYQQNKTASAALLFTELCLGKVNVKLEEVRRFFAELEDQCVEEYTPEAIAFAQWHIAGAIADYSDFKTRLSLRNSSKLVRKIVDARKTRIDVVHVEYGPSYNFFTSNGFKLEVIPKDRRLDDTSDHCFVIKNNERIRIDGINYDDLTKNILSTFLLNKKLTIGKWEFVEMPGFNPNFSQGIFQFLHRFFQEANVKLKIEELSMKTEEATSANFLQCCDPTILTKLEVYHSNEGHDFNQLIRICSDPCWKNLKVFMSDFRFDGLESNNHVDLFTHFIKAEFKMQNSLTPTSLIRMKNNLLKNHRLQEMKIYHNMTREQFVFINEQLKTFNLPGQEDPVWAYFAVPKLQYKTLALCVTDTYVWFKGPCYG